MVFLFHPGAFLALGVLVLLWALVAFGWLVVSALWDVLLFGVVLLALALPFRFWGRMTYSRTPMRRWYPLTVLAILAFVTFESRELQSLTGIRTSVPIYNLTGVALGGLGEEMRDSYEREIGRAVFCDEVASGARSADDLQRDNCAYTFPDGVDLERVAAIRTALDANDLPAAQSALETFQEQPYFHVRGVWPANYSSFASWWENEAAKGCVGDPSRMGFRTALLYCAGTSPTKMDAFCEARQDRIRNYAMLRELCPGAGRQVDRDAVRSLAQHESLLCSEGVCWNLVLDDRTQDNGRLNMFEWLKKRAGW